MLNSAVGHVAFPELQSIRGMLAVPESQSDQDNASTPNPPVPKAGPLRAELHAVGQLLQIMEDAWLGLASGTSDLPMNRGWMNAFRRWVGTGVPAFLAGLPLPDQPRLRSIP